MDVFECFSMVWNIFIFFISILFVLSLFHKGKNFDNNFSIATEIFFSKKIYFIPWSMTVFNSTSRYTKIIQFTKMNITSIRLCTSEIDASPSNTQISRKLDGKDQIRFLIDFLFYSTHITFLFFFPPIQDKNQLFFIL